MVAVLRFSIDWELSGEEQQDFFLFNGQNKSAHFFRKNNSLILYLELEENITIWEYTDPSPKFTFSWPEYNINGVKMNVIRFEGNMSRPEFDQFTFMSPIVDTTTECNLQTLIEPSYFMKINYGYITLIVAVVGITLKLSVTSPEFYSQMIDMLRKWRIREQDYVTMSPL